jgi:hypothetical protein
VATTFGATARYQPIGSLGCTSFQPNSPLPNSPVCLKKQSWDRKMRRASFCPNLPFAQLGWWFDT